MKKTFLGLALLGISIHLFSMQVMEIPPAERLLYPQEKAILSAEKYGPVVGVLLGSLGAMAIVGTAGYGLHKANQSKISPLIPTVALVASPTPILMGLATGKYLTNTIAILWLARKYQVPTAIVKASLKFAIPLSTDRELLTAAYTGKTEQIQHILQDKMVLYFGAMWKNGFQTMLNDFEQVMKIEQSNVTDRQKLKKLRDLKYLETYNAQQRQYLSLVMRLLLAVYDLYYKKPLAVSNHGVYTDPHLYMTNEWLRTVRYMYTHFLEGQTS